MPSTILEMLSLPDGQVVDAELASDIEKEAAFVSEHMRDLIVDVHTQKVTFSVTDPARTIEVRDKVEAFVKVMLTGYRPVPSKVIRQRERSDPHPIDGNVFDALVDAGWVCEIGKGHVALAGPALKLFHLVDRIIATLYKDAFAYEDRHFPALIPSSLMADCGYFDSHPNNVSFANHLRNDFDVIEGFRKRYGEDGDLTEFENADLATPHTCLNPAACLPSYFTMKDQTLAANKCLSWNGRVFRHEASNLRGLERLWEYNVREIVFVGDPEYVEDARTKGVSLVAELLDQLDLSFQITTSTDPFFATVASIRKFFQKATEAKHEVKIDIDQPRDGDARSIAAGSVNYHDAFFGQKFAITGPNGEPAVSACIGLGIERIVLCCFAQHGITPDRWPDAIANEIFEGSA